MATVRPGETMDTVVPSVSTRCAGSDPGVTPALFALDRRAATSSTRTAIEATTMIVMIVMIVGSIMFCTIGANRAQRGFLRTHFGVRRPGREARSASGVDCLDVVHAQLIVRGNQRESFELRLRYQHAVKGVPVVERKRGC